jgi:preprotein translocase subunit SecY
MYGRRYKEGVVSRSIIFIQSFMKICQLVHELLRRNREDILDATIMNQLSRYLRLEKLIMIMTMIMMSMA